MLVGHLGVGLAAKAAEPKLNLGTLFLAAMLLDVALWVFVLMGFEAATVPPDYATRHYLYFNFPYSHSLLAAILWSVVAAVAYAAFTQGGEFSARMFSSAAIVLAAVVFSHWILDFLVHPREMPITPGGPTLGLGLWDQPPLGLEVELVIAGFGLLFYLLRPSGSRRLAVTIAVLAAAAMTVWGALMPTPPPSIHTLAYVSLVMIGVLVGIAWWADARVSGTTP